MVIAFHQTTVYNNGCMDMSSLVKA